MRRHRRSLVALTATVVVLVALGWWWGASLLPRSYSLATMGLPDGGGGPVAMDMGPDTGPDTGGARSVTDLRDADEVPPDVAVTLVARQERFSLASGRAVAGYTLNGTSPGPEIRARQGQLLQVTLVNASVADGVTLHWHGVDVPNAEDGVAGVTQDAVGPGASFVYRFRVRDAGTYWYHSHQTSDPQVRGGLFGALVVDPPGGPGPGSEVAAPDVVAPVHLYDGRRTVAGRDGELAVDAPPGARVRVRIVDTDNGAVRAWSPQPFRVLAVDGHDVHEPTPVTGAAVGVPAGGRVDVEVLAPARVVVGDVAVVVGGAPPAPGPAPPATLDLLTYGSPVPLGFDPDRATRRFDYAIGRTFGVVDGVPGLWWTVNGHLYPDVPMFMVAEGDVVRMHLTNTSGDVHPMHLHGHHGVVLARDGRPATGSPWWFDTLDVPDGASLDIAFVADNPGLWMDHCHNLAHAAQGLVAHLMYEGVTTPFRAGSATRNVPE